MPIGSGAAISAAGSWKIGVSSSQLEARNSMETKPVSPGDEQHDDIGEREAAAFAAARKPAEDDADEGVIAPPVGDRAADERQDRQRQAARSRRSTGTNGGKTPAPATLASTSTSSPSSAATIRLSAARSIRRSHVSSGLRRQRRRRAERAICSSDRDRHDLHRAGAHHSATCARVEIPRTPFMQLPPDGAASC